MKVTFTALGPEGTEVETVEFEDGTDLQDILKSEAHLMFSEVTPEERFVFWEVEIEAKHHLAWKGITLPAKKIRVRAGKGPEDGEATYL